MKKKDLYYVVLYMLLLYAALICFVLYVKFILLTNLLKMKTKLAIFCAFISFNAIAQNLPSESDITSYLSKTPYKTQKYTDDSCNAKRLYFFKDEPNLTIELKCNQLNVRWVNFDDDAKFDAANKKVNELARQAMFYISGYSNNEFDTVKSGKVLKANLTKSGLLAWGSCSLSSCFVSYYKN